MLDPATDPMITYALLVVVGAIASGINSVAGGGSLVSFPTLTIGLGVPTKIANATNSVGLWPGSLSGAVGFWNVLGKTKHHLKLLAFPTLLGSIAGAYLLIITRETVFSTAVPILLLIATLLLLFQPNIKAWSKKHQKEVSPTGAWFLQFLVATYGGYFGAGMGIMMLAVFTLFMEGTIHEINAVKTWLGVIINLVASIVLFANGLVKVDLAIALTIGSLIGGYWAARVSQRFDSEKLRIAIAVYGLITTGYFVYDKWIA